MPARKPAASNIKLHVVEENEPFTADDGKRIWASGYTVIDDTTGSFMSLADQHFDNPHCLLCHVAGVTHRPEALQDPRFAPGHGLLLRPEPTNPYDHNAVGIWDATGEVQLGFVPAEHSEQIAMDIRNGTQLVGLAMREFRHGESGPRLGIHVLIAPAGTVELVIDAED